MKTTRPTDIDALRALPGIDLSKLAPRTQVFVETINCVYQLTVLDPIAGTVRLNTTDRRFRNYPSCEFVSSRVVGLNVEVPRWVGSGLQMVFEVSSSVQLICRPALAAGVRGDGWHFDVFQ